MEEQTQQANQADDGVIKVSMDKPAVEQSDDTVKISLDQQNKQPEEEVETEQTVAEEAKETVETEIKEPEAEAETPVLELIEETEEVEQTAEEEVTTEDVIQEAANDPKIELPDNIQKVVDFMNETGGTLEDYVSLNKDYSKLSDNELLKKYYKDTKPHLDDEEIDFLIEDSFDYDEEIDEERDIRKKKLMLKETVANAKSHLESLKGKYYEDVKLMSKLSPEQKEAVTFYNEFKNEKESAEKQKSAFLEKTKKVFSNEFKGFEYKVGEKKFRFNVNDTEKVKSRQSDINNFVQPYLNENNELSDAAGYHKALFTAMNPDAIANHFYEQGKADAIKKSLAEAKNIDMNPRGAHEGNVTTNGIKVRAVSGDDSSKLRIKIKS